MFVDDFERKFTGRFSENFWCTGWKFGKSIQWNFLDEELKIDFLGGDIFQALAKHLQTHCIFLVSWSIYYDGAPDTPVGQYWTIKLLDPKIILISTIDFTIVSK